MSCRLLVCYVRIHPDTSCGPTENKAPGFKRIGVWPGIRFLFHIVVLPDGKRVPGFLDDEGFARLDGLLTSGTCKVQFPNLDRDAWEWIATLAEKEMPA